MEDEKDYSAHKRCDEMPIKNFFEEGVKVANDMVDNTIGIKECDLKVKVLQDFGFEEGRVTETYKEEVTEVHNQMLTSGSTQGELGVGMNLEKNLKSPKSTEDGLKSVDEGNGLVVNMVAGSIIGVEGNNGLSADQPLTSGFNRVGIGDLSKCEVRSIDKNQKCIIVWETKCFNCLDISSLIQGYVDKANMNVELIPTTKQVFDPGGK